MSNGEGEGGQKSAKKSHVLFKWPFTVIVKYLARDRYGVL